MVFVTKNFYSFILKSEIRGYKRTFASQFWIFWACFVYFFLISPGNTFEKRQQKQRLAFFSKLCWDENHNIKPDLIAKSQNIPLLIKKNTAKTKQLFKSDYNINEKKFLVLSVFMQNFSDFFLLKNSPQLIFFWNIYLLTWLKPFSISIFIESAAGAPC